MFVLAMLFALPINAAAPYQTYTYSIDGKALYSPDAYVPASTISSDYMGLTTALKDPSDIEVDENQNVYIADSGNNRVVVLDPYYKVKFVIDKFVNEHGVDDAFANPQGVFITKSKIVNGKEVPGRIFVCDTDKNRIVTFDLEGNFESIIPQPESELFDEGSTYMPVAVAVDQYDRMYVGSSTTYQGIIVLNTDGDFFGFIGATKVTVNALELLWRKTM